MCHGGRLLGNRLILGSLELCVGEHTSIAELCELLKDGLGGESESVEERVVTASLRVVPKETRACAEELFALKRIHFDRGTLTSELQFAAPDEPGEYVYSVRLVSDSYIGLDCEVEVTVVVEER